MVMCIFQGSWGKIWHVMLRNNQDTPQPCNLKDNNTCTCCGLWCLGQTMVSARKVSPNQLKWSKIEVFFFRRYLRFTMDKIETNKDLIPVPPVPPGCGPRAGAGLSQGEIPSATGQSARARRTGWGLEVCVRWAIFWKYDMIMMMMIYTNICLFWKL
jgi:hypothetical protein